MRASKGIFNALGAAVLFGASTPLAKMLVGEISPVLLAGLFYAGSGVGLALALVLRRVARHDSAWITFAWPRGADIAWFAMATLFGGVIGPVLLMVGLSSTDASITALLLNLEAVFTAVIAWFVFHENFDRRIAAGMALIVVGGIVLSWVPGPRGLSSGVFAIAAACLCWAIDNNLTRKVAASDAMAIACVKGLVAGAVNISAAVWIGAAMPSLSITTAAAVVGFAGYGISLVLFVLALRDLGTARTGAYFSVAPFVGAALALFLQNESISTPLVVAGVLMAWGVWLHVSEVHEHTHLHQHIEHSHSHAHDIHHRHVHDFPWDGTEPHTHPHVHRPLRHAHPHYPDIHHRHEH
jgi:drug/metabolite transporter (DMT)-like permease